MRIVDFIREDLIVPELQGTSKEAVLEELAGQLAETTTAVNKDDLVKVLAERERLASTAIGEGIAIPHGKMNSIGKLVACIGRSHKGVNFDSMDGKPTHIFFVLVAPENSTGVHLKALARISRLFKDAEFRSHLMEASDAHDMYRIISEEDAKY